METIDNIIYFESDEEFEDFCVAPYASIKQSDKGTNYCAGDYSDILKNVLKRASSLLLKTETQKYLSGKRLQNVYR